MAITKDGGRQYPLWAEVEFAYTDFTSGVSAEAIDLPGNAVVVGGELVITTAFNSATSDTFIVGDGAVTNRYANAVNGAAAARTALTLTGFRYTTPDTVDVRWTGVGAAPSAGAGVLRVQYILKNRSNEVQPV